MKARLIAEIGWNHLGDMGLACHMIDAAARSGADIVKFQTWSVSRLTSGSWDHDGRRKLYGDAELSDDDHVMLKAHCESAGVGFLTACFSAHDVSRIASLCDSVKVPSPEIANIDLLEAVARTFSDTIYLSTGASTLDEVRRAVDILSTSRAKLVLMHCVSAYPCPIADANIARMGLLADTFGLPTGYSGHCHGISDALAALARGAVVVEKHFTVSRELPGRDNAFAIIPDELAMLANFARDVDTLLGSQDDVDVSRMRDCELQAMQYRGRWDTK